LHGDWITNRLGTRYLAAIAGPIGAGKTALAGNVADALSATLIKDPATPVSRDASPMVRAGRIFSWQVQSSEVRAKAITWFALMKCRSNAISDYWLEQSLCDAEMELPLDELSGYLDRFDAALAKAAKPNLLVFLDVLPEVSWKRIHERGPIPSWLNRDWLVRYRDVLLAKITAPKRGPLLRLDGTKLGEAKDELIAAIQAMQ
jgi:hypothetical protein